MASTHRSRRALLLRAVDETLAEAFRFVERHSFLQEPFNSLLGKARAQTTLLCPRRSGCRFDPSQYRRVVCGLLYVAMHRGHWLRSVDDWQPGGGSPQEEIRALANHLFAEYPVPGFLARAWFDPSSDEFPVRPEKVFTQRWLMQQALFKHLGAGRSVRQFAGLPLRLSKAMAKCFMQVPDHLTLHSALRWSQVRGLGGTPELARAIVAKHSTLPRLEEVSSADVVAALVRWDTPPCLVAQIIDFIHRQRIKPRHEVLPGYCGDDRAAPIDAGFSLKGRTLRSMMRYIINWRDPVYLRRPLPRRMNRVAQPWLAMDAGPFVLGLADRPGCVWTIREITTPEELYLEGKTMRHCVGSFAFRCMRRASSIWSMKFEQGETQNHALTIEVQPSTRVVCTAKGYRNARPTTEQRRILEMWAARENLVVRC